MNLRQIERIHVVTDLHFLANGNPTCSQKIDYIAKTMDKEHDLLLVLGDCTENGYASEYKHFLEIILSCGLKNRVIMVPGNHDYRYQGVLWDEQCCQNFVECKKLLCAVNLFEGEDKPSKQFCVLQFCEGIKLVILDSSWQGGLARGFICSEQMKKLQIVLHQTKQNGGRVIIALHHDPCFGGFTSCLKNSNDLRNLLAQYSKQIWVVLSGHNHRYEDSQVNGVRFCTLGDLSNGGAPNYLILDLLDENTDVKLLKVFGQ